MSNKDSKAPQGDLPKMANDSQTVSHLRDALTNRLQTSNEHVLEIKHMTTIHLAEALKPKVQPSQPSPKQTPSDKK
jgi:hypothetical protein